MIQEYYLRTLILSNGLTSVQRINTPFADLEFSMFHIQAISGNGMLYIGQDTMISPLADVDPANGFAEFDGLAIPLTTTITGDIEIGCQRYVSVGYVSQSASDCHIVFSFKRQSDGKMFPMRHLSTAEKPQPQYDSLTFEKKEVNGIVAGNDVALPKGHGVKPRTLTEYMATIREGSMKTYGNE